MREIAPALWMAHARSKRQVIGPKAVVATYNLSRSAGRAARCAATENEGDRAGTPSTCLSPLHLHHQSRAPPVPLPPTPGRLLFANAALPPGILPGHCTAAFLDDLRDRTKPTMNDEALRDLARRAGIAVEWHDYANQPHVVAPDALHRILAALGLPADTRGDLAASRRVLAKRATLADLPPLVTATAGRPTRLDLGAADPRPAKLLLERGGSRDLTLMPARGRLRIPAVAGDRLSPPANR